MPFPDASGSAGAGHLDETEGQTVGLFSSHVPRELVYALGCTPVRVFPSAAKSTAAEAYLPGNFCALNRLILASYLGDEPANLDGVIFADEDDTARRLHDVWRSSVDIPVWAFLEVPRSATPLAVKRYTEILTRAIPVLEARSQAQLEVGALQQSITTFNEQRGLTASLKRHWLMRSLDTAAYRRLRRLTLTRDPALANKQLRSALEELASYEPGPRAAPSPEHAPRGHLLLLAELAAPTALVRLIEAYGARLVAEDSDLDERDVSTLLPTEATTLEELLAELARAYLAKPPGPRNRLLSQRLAYLERIVMERKVRAAICVYGKFCDLYLAEFPSIKSHLEKLGVPVLLLEVEDETISGQHRTRVEALLELLN
jgi:benzoyl-CoA reductase/2-hydroxyglutaryl-CoA dehydratase subunit BcrC/BadD/HgdB